MKRKMWTQQTSAAFWFGWMTLNALFAAQEHNGLLVTANMLMMFLWWATWRRHSIVPGETNVKQEED